MLQNPQTTISKTTQKNHNQFRSVKTEALIWVQINTDAGMKLKHKTTVKEVDKKLLDFITIYVLKIGHNHTSSQQIMTLPMNPIINIPFNKHPMSWELIHRRLLHCSESVMK